MPVKIAKNPFPDPILLERNPDSWHHDKIANIIPNAERYNQVNLYIYSGYPIRSNGLTALEIKFLECAAIRFK
tara:strand:+ start:570 stop:788 length:219 start_codon:yes stop_codon:yes gene_type:complete